MRPNLTIRELWDLKHEDLVERCDALLAVYDQPQVETRPEKLARLELALEECPVMYRWFLSMKSYFDYSTAGSTQIFGTSDRDTKKARQRRDLFSDMASAAKMRHASASRLITLLIEFEPDGLVRHRTGAQR